MTAPTEQPMPIPRDVPSVQGMVIADLSVRLQVGIERYGTPLQPHNGRDALRDLYEELLDAACYARQAIEERPREDVDAAVLAVRAELEPEIERRDALIAELRRQLDASVRMRDRYVASHRELERQRKAAGELLATLKRIADSEAGDIVYTPPEYAIEVAHKRGRAAGFARAAEIAEQLLGGGDGG